MIRVPKSVIAHVKKEHGRKLDQIESCYRQYQPPQLRQVNSRHAS